MSREKKPIHQMEIKDSKNTGVGTEIENAVIPINKKNTPTENTSVSKEIITDDGHNQDSNGDINAESNNQVETTDKDKVSVTQTDVTDSRNKSDDNESKNSRKKTAKKILTTSIFSVLLLGGLGGVSYFLYTKNANSSFMDFNSTRQVSPQAEDQYLKIKIEVDQVKGQLTGLTGMKSELLEMKEQVDLMNTKVDNLRDELTREVEAFYQRSQDRDSQITQLRIEVKDMLSRGELSHRTLKQHEEKLSALEEQQINDTKALQAKLVSYEKRSNSKATITPEKAKISSNKKVSSPQEPRVKTTNNLGYLYLEQIVPFGNQKIAQFTDGVSGAIQIVEGDVIGGYRIIKIGTNYVTAKSNTGENIKVVTGDDA